MDFIETKSKLFMTSSKVYKSLGQLAFVIILVLSIVTKPCNERTAMYGMKTVHCTIIFQYDDGNI